MRPVLLHFERWFQTLHLYGAAGIAAFGWALCALLGWPAAPWLPLWACAALLVYNVDRLRPDPADAINTPRRAVAASQLRWASKAVTVSAAAVLIALPAARGDWLTLALVIAGSIVSLSYSLPLFGCRLKTAPLLKSFFAPTIVAVSVFALPLLHGAPHPPAAHLLAVFAWAWSFLVFNMLLWTCATSLATALPAS